MNHRLRQLSAAAMLAGLLAAPVALAELLPVDLAAQLVHGALMEAPKNEVTALSTTNAEILATADQALGGFVRASVVNQDAAIAVCVGWSGGLAITCATAALDCDGDDDDGVEVKAGERYSPIYSATKLGRLCGVSASGTPSVKVTYDTP